MMAVIAVTWKEVLRKRVIFITSILTVLFLLVETLGAYGLRQINSVVDKRDLGQGFMAAALYMSNFVVAYLAIFSAAPTISSEVENGILLSILPRPVHRWQVYMGKWLGYAAWAGLYGLLVYWTQVLIVGWQFGFSTFGNSVGAASGVLVLIPLVLTSLSMLGSTYFPTLANGIFVMLISFCIPTDALYRLVSYDVTGGGSSFKSNFGPFSSPIVPNHLFLVYVVAYVFVLVMWGIVRFSRKDM